MELIKIAYKFIKKNRYQLKKNLKAMFTYKNPIKLINYYDSSYKYKFYLLLEYLYKNNLKEVMILGRYNNDINELMDEVKYKDLNLKYLTVHKAKGLESENIILINMVDKVLGFPSKLEHIDIYKKIFSSNEKYPFAEERRLFYVALTRAKGNVFIMNNKNKESIFIKEIKSKTIELKL
jgi:DNA helicase-4